MFLFLIVKHVVFDKKKAFIVVNIKIHSYGSGRICSVLGAPDLVFWNAFNFFKSKTCDSVERKIGSCCS